MAPRLHQNAELAMGNGEGKDGMNIYIICPVRGGLPLQIAEIRDYCQLLRRDGHKTHFPFDDVDQEDPTGSSICDVHFNSMLWADEVHVFWDESSKGSHFDLGMAFALGKRVIPIKCYSTDAPGKSYWKVMNERAANSD